MMDCTSASLGTKAEPFSNQAIFRYITQSDIEVNPHKPLTDIDAQSQVEFPPTFEEQPMKEQWSWDQNPINLTCIATAIPNATITWWVRDREIDREIIDRNFRVVGHGPRSDLIVTPLDLQYYGRYTCKAVNPHGEAFYEIELKEAREPSYIQQVTDSSNPLCLLALTVFFRL